MQALRTRVPSEDPALAFLLERHDRDADGRIGAEEYGRDFDAFARLDRSGDGWIDQTSSLLRRSVPALARDDGRRTPAPERTRGPVRTGSVLEGAAPCRDAWLRTSSSPGWRGAMRNS